MSSTAQPVPRAKGPYATTRRVGDVLYLAGQGSINPETGDPVDGDIGAQTRLTLANIERLLESEGFGLEDLVQVVCYLRNIDDWSAMNDAYADYFGGRAAPTRTAVGVASLPFGLDVEMTGIAHRAAAGTNAPRETLRAARFDLTLSPWRDGDPWAGFDVRYRAELPTIPAGEPVLGIPERIASIPGAPYRTEDLRVRDSSGPLTLREAEGTSDPSGTYRHWVADRGTDGTVEVTVRAPVRPVDAHTPVGPLFDLRAEPLGVLGAGLTFLPLPPGDDAFTIRLRWEVPDGVVGLSSRGAGDQEWQGPLRTVAFSYYAAGTPETVPTDATTFGVHAFSEPTFDVAPVTGYVRELHAGMSRFFGDEGSGYHVFVRRNPGPGSGGTALPGSFAFGYSPAEPVVEDELRGLLAHEMAHNWPALDAEHVDGAWFTEGTAEYYSLVLPLRLGLSTPGVLAGQLTEKLVAYDTNPLRTLTNEAAGAAFWADPRAQRIPYGRGLRYLIATDARIRAATDGARSLDDVVTGIVRARRAGGKVGLDGWLDRVQALVGDAARTQFDAMVEGRPIALPEGPFEGVVRAREVEAPEFDLGFDVASFQAEPRRVQGLVPGAAAARAGLREGDELLSRSLPASSMRDAAATVTLAVRRDGAEHQVTYVPRGRAVPAVEWIVADAATGQG